MLVTDLEEVFVQMQKTFPQEILLPDAHCVDQTSNISVAFQFRLRWSKLHRSSSSLWRGYWVGGGGRGHPGAQIIGNSRPLQCNTSPLSPQCCPI